MKRLLLFVLLLFTGLTYGSSILFTGSGGSGITKYATFADLPHPCVDGDVAVTTDTGIIYVCESNVWQPSAGPGAPLSLGTFDGNTVDAKGASIAANVLYMQSADATHPGEVNTSTQSFAGDKSLAGNFIPANNYSDVPWNLGSSSFRWNQSYIQIMSTFEINGFGSPVIIGNNLLPSSDLGTAIGTNTSRFSDIWSGTMNASTFTVNGVGVATIQLPNAGASSYNFNLPNDAGTSGYLLTSAGGGSSEMTWTDPSSLALSLAAFGSTPNGNGLTLTANVLNMEPADATNPGGVSITTQTFAGNKTFSDATSIAPGSVSFPGLYLSGDTTTGIYRPGVDQFNIGVLGAAVANFGTSGLAVTGLFTATSTVQGTRLISTIATGTAPLTVSSTTRVSNLNVATSGQSDTVATTQVSNNASYFPLMVASSTNSNQAPDLGTGLTFNPSTNTMSTTTFVGALTGTASGNTTLTPTNHGVVLSGAANAMTATAAGSAGQVLRSGGASADPAYSTATYPSTATSTGTFLREDGTNFVASGTTIPDTGTSGGILGYTASGVLASSGALTQHAIVLGGGAGATPSVLASLGTTSTVLHGAAAGDPTFGAIVNADITNSTIDLTAKVTGALPIANGGTGQTTKAPAFDALSPMTTGGDIIYGGASGTGTRLANGSSGQVLTSAGGTSAPTWASAPSPVMATPTQQIFTSSSGTYNKDYTFVISSGSATIGATYTNNAVTYTVYGTVASATQVVMSGNGAPAASGTLTKASGTGDATLTFSQVLAPLYLHIRLVGPGGGGAGSGTTGGGAGSNGSAATTFGSLTGNVGVGAPSTTAGSGGTGSGGNVLNINGGSGTGGGLATGGSSQIAGGNGGSAPYFGGGGAGQANNAGGTGLTNTGGGGAGGGFSGVTAQAGGGGGAGGYVEHIQTAPAATYSYVVGAGGGAGTAGTSGQTGSAGAAGIIVVQEYYQ